MFSHNGKISEKQMRRMLVLSTFASSIFVVPYLSARLFGISVVPGLLLFLVLAALYTAFVFGIGSCMELEKGRITQQGVAGKGIGDRILVAVQIVRLMLRLAFYLVLSVAILGEAQVPFMQGRASNNIWNFLVVVPLLLVAVYGANLTRICGGRQTGGERCAQYLGIEKQGRIYELIFPVLFVPFIVMVLFGLGEVDDGIFFPHMGMSFGKMLFYAYGLLTFILPVENYLYWKPNLNRKKGSVKWMYTSTLAVLILLCVLTLLLDGIFGIHGAGKEEMLTIAIMRYIRLPFGVLERFDMLMLWFFMTGCFVLICSTLYQIGDLFAVFFKNVKRIWVLLGVSVVVWFAAARLPDYPDTLLLFLYYGAWIDVPLSLLLPLVKWSGCKLRDRKNRKEPEKKTCRLKKMGSLLFLSGTVLLLSGCRGDLSARNDMRNVEERDYGTILFISKGENGKRYHFDLGIAQEKRVGQKSQIEKVSRWDCDDFKELAREYQKIKGKDLSLSHLKVILLASDGETVMKRDLQDLLGILDENEEIAKTCPVLQVTEREAFLRYLEEAGSPVGSYLEAVIRTGERQKKNIPWLKDYLKAMREEQGVEVYLLESVPEGWTVKRYTFLFRAAE